MPYYTRVFTKQEEFPSLEELAQFVRSEHPGYKLTLEDGTEEDWESLLLSGDDEVGDVVLAAGTVKDRTALEDGDFYFVGAREEQGFPVLFCAFFEGQLVTGVFGADKLGEFFEGREFFLLCKHSRVVGHGAFLRIRSV